MDNRLVLAVLFVTVSLMSVGTFAQANVTATANSTTVTPTVATTAGNNTTMAATAGSNTTMAATAGSNTTMAATAGSNTTMAATAGSNTTMAATAGSNTTMAATMGSNTTMAATMGSNTTMAATMGSNTTMAATMGSNTTMAATTVAPAVTTVGPLTPNTTVETLGTPISNEGCGSVKLCAAEPATCDPTAGECIFASAKLQSGQNFDFEVSGQSNGYLALGLSSESRQGSNDTTYVCANNNNVVQFFTTVLNNGVLTQTPLNANSVKGKVNGTTIQCTFSASVQTPTTRSSSNVAISVSTGTFNSTSGALGTPSQVLRSNVVNLANPNTTVVNQITTNTTTPAPNTTVTASAYSIRLQQTVTQALLISASALGLAML